MTSPVRLLRAEEGELIADVCRVLGLDPGADVRTFDACIQIRTRLVLERSPRAAASTALIVPAPMRSCAGRVTPSRSPPWSMVCS